MMENLPKNILIKIVLDFELYDIINFCLTSSIINRKVGLNQMFWMKKLMEFDINNRADIPEKYKLKDGRFDYKKYYLYIDHMLKKYSNSNDLLVFGSEEGELNLVKIALKKGANIHVNNDKALRCASRNGYFEIVKYLIDEGANIYAQNNWAWNWSSRNGHINIVKLLIKEGTNIHAQDDTALIWSSINGHINVVRFLINQGANIHAQDDRAFKGAIEGGHLEVVKFLIESGANDVN